MFRRDRLHRFGVVLGYVSLAIAFAWPLPLHLGSALTGDPGGDTGVYVWNQWVFQYEALVDRHSPMTTERILSLTAPVDLSQHNYTPFLNLLAMPLIQVIGVVAAFNVVLLGMMVLTALTTYALARHGLNADRSVAWLAGAAFAWCPALVARTTGHFSLVAAAPLPAFLLCLILAHRTRRPREALLAGLCVAWAGYCDPYYAVYCVMISAGFIVSQIVMVARSPDAAPRAARWALDALLLLTAAVVATVVFTGGGRFELAGLSVSMRSLYTPVFAFTILLVMRLVVALRLRPRLTIVPSMRTIQLLGVASIACALALAPMLMGLAARVLDGRFVAPQTMWRSSPRGVDLLAFVAPNPNNPLVRTGDDRLARAPTEFVEFTAAFSLVALAVVAFACWRAGYRPGQRWIWLTVGFAGLALGPFVYVAGVNTYVPGPWSLLRYMPVIGLARMPTRFSVVAALGLAVLLTGALAALARRYPQHRRAMLATIGLALLVELSPAPRPLYSARMPSIYDIIAADPRPMRILELPLGVRDGVSGVGNLSSRYQFYQTHHGKPIIGGYLSRISPKRLREFRAQPTLDALLTLSEGGTLSAEHAARIRARGPGFVRRSNLGYVVINHARAPQALIEFVTDAWRLEEVAREWPKVLYRPTVAEVSLALR